MQYKLPTHPLKEVDVKRAKEALNQLVKMGVCAEQRGVAKHGLNSVIGSYLPEELKHPGGSDRKLTGRR